MSDSWARYIEDGRRAVELHPDYDSDDFATCATDMIASILHAAVESAGEFDPEEMLARALRTYVGDFEDQPRAVPLD